MKNAEFKKITTFQVEDSEAVSLFMSLLGVVNDSMKNASGRAHVVIEVESEGNLYIVSSIFSLSYKETMVFPVIGGDIDYLDVGFSEDFLDFSGALDNAGMNVVNKDDLVAAIESHEDYPTLARFIDSSL